MKKTLSPYIVCALLILDITGCQQDTAPAPVLRARSSYSPYGSGEELPLRWSNNHLTSGLVLKIASEIADSLDFGDGENGHTDAALEWNNALPGKTVYALPFPIVANREIAQLTAYYDDELGIYKSENWYPEVGASALAITQFFGVRRSSASGQYIELQHADIILNYRDYSFTSDTEDFTAYDLPSVLLHEMGHFAGLRHEYSTYDSVMRPSLGSFESERQLYAVDINNLRLNYSDADIQQLSSGPTSNSVIRSNTMSSDEHPELVQGRFELRANGNCVHYINGHQISTHATTATDLFNRIDNSFESI